MILTGIPRNGNSCHSLTGTEKFSFFWWYRNQYRKNLVLEKVSEPVSVKFGIGKKVRNWYRKNLVPKKVPVSVSKIFSTGKSIGIGIVQHFGYRHTLPSRQLSDTYQTAYRHPHILNNLGQLREKE